MSDHTFEEFDFEEWARMASEDPQAFEARRQELVGQLLDSAPEGVRQRLRGLQWQLDQVRERSGTPLAACMDMSRMMWENVLGEEGLLDSMHALGKQGTEVQKKPAAAILEFKKKSTD